MDSNYRERVLARREIIAEHASTVAGVIPAGYSAVQELYTFLLQDYLPVRYPDMFSVEENGQTFQNKVTGVASPMQCPDDPLEAFRILGETVEDDLFLLHETEKGHLAVAFLCCHPAGFDPATKLGKILAEIHAPVPSYEKIGPSMERFFSKLEVGKNVKRVNVCFCPTVASWRKTRLADMWLQWSVTTHPRLFSPSGQHVYDGDVVEENETIDIEKVRSFHANLSPRRDDF